MKVNGTPGKEFFERLESYTMLSHLNPADKVHAQEYFAKGIDITSSDGKQELIRRIRAFQRQEGIPSHGIIDDVTLTKMKEKIADAKAKAEAVNQRVVQQFAPPSPSIETIAAESLAKNVEKAQQAFDEAKRALEKAQQAAEAAIQVSRRENTVEKAQQAAEKTQQALDAVKNVEKAQQALDKAKRALEKTQQARTT